MANCVDTPLERMLRFLSPVKKKARKFASVRPDGINGQLRFIVTWTPKPYDRRRKSFVTEVDAEAEADRIETLMSEGAHAVTNVPAWRLTAINSALNLLADDDGSVLLSVLQSYTRQESAVVANWGSVKEVGIAFMASRSKTSVRQQQTVKSHITKLMAFFGEREYASIEAPDYERYLTEEVGGAGKSQNNHLITLKSMGRWARDIGLGKRKFLPPGPAAVEHVQRAQVDHSEHEVYQAEQFMRLLVYSPANMVVFLVLGQFAGIRAAERTRLRWQHWRCAEDNKIVLNPDVTKTKQRRRVDVMDSLTAWLTAFRGEANEMMVTGNPHKQTVKLAEAAAVPWIDNALRAGYASYHLELFDNAALTAKNDGHSVSELETSYKSISGVTKKTAQAMFAITPQSVLDFAKQQKLPTPEWAGKIQSV